MTKKQAILALAVAALPLASCSDEQEPARKVLTLLTEGDIRNNSKMYHEEDPYSAANYFEEGDNIYVNGEVLSVESAVENPTHFLLYDTWQPWPGDFFLATFPSNLLAEEPASYSSDFYDQVTGLNQKTVKVVYPRVYRRPDYNDEYSYLSNSKHLEYPMIALENRVSDQLRFHNLCAIFRVDLANRSMNQGFTIDSVQAYVSDNNYHSLSGPRQVTVFEGTTASPVITDINYYSNTEAHKTVSIDLTTFPDSWRQIEADDTKVVSFPIPPTTGCSTPPHIYVRVYGKTSENVSMMFERSANLTFFFERNKIYTASYELSIGTDLVINLSSDATGDDRDDMGNLW
ncbi:MAG: hypothetical protein SPL12_05140 [Bacteroidales bacterium]|nr:hypothetical protein [Bacteroidales bacterium]